MTNGTGTRSLSAERNERARAFLRNLIDSQFGGSISAASRALGVTYSALHEVMNGKRGVGMRLLDAAKAYTGTPITEILGETEPPTASVHYLRIGDYPTWAAAETAARLFGTTIPEWVWSSARQSVVVGVGGAAVSPQFALELASLIEKHGRPG